MLNLSQRHLIIAGAIALLVTACGDDETPTAVVGEPIRFQPAASGVTTFGEIPWPSDLYRDADGNVGEVPGLERLVSSPARISHGLQSLDGFGRSTGAIFFLAAAVDNVTLPGNWEAATARTASVFIADVDQSSP